MQHTVKMTRRLGAEAAINLRQRRRWFDDQGSGDATPPGDAGATQTPPSGETPPETWDAWLAGRPEAERPIITRLLDTHTAPLQKALNEERTQRKQFETTIRELQSKAEKGSDAEKKLTETVALLDAANRRADFVTAAAKTENGVADIEAAWLIVNANAAKFIKSDGAIDFKALREAHPILFKAAPPPKGNAGSGTTEPPPAQGNMNDWIRTQARR